MQPLELLSEPKRYLQRVSLYPPFCVGETMDEVNTVYILLFGSGLRLIANWGFIVNQQPADVSRLLIGGHSSTKTSYWLIKIESSLPTTEVNWTSLDIHLITRPIKRKYEKLSKTWSKNIVGKDGKKTALTCGEKISVQGILQYFVLFNNRNDLVRLGLKIIHLNWNLWYWK